MKAIIYTMASSGIRLGAWDYLKWSHIKPIIRNDQAIAARITVCAGENEQYHSYITPEALKALLEWMDYLKPLVQDLGMHDVISRLDPRDRWTHWWESKNIASQMDYILLSPKLADNSPAKPYIERRGISNKRKKFSYLNFRAEENKIPFNFNRFNDVSDEFEASDHCPVFFELKL
jgi:exonuclease III